MGIAGTVLNAVAVVCIIGWMFFAAVILANDPEFVEAFDEGMDEALIEMEESDNEFNWD